MNTQAQKLITAVNKGESVRIIRGDVDGMKVLEWIEANLPDVQWQVNMLPTKWDRFPEMRTEVLKITSERILLRHKNADGQKATHTFQASDILKPDYERIGDKFERDGEWWQEVKPGQVIEGVIERIVTDQDITVDGAVDSREIYTTTNPKYPWMSCDSGYKHLALPTTAPEPKTVRVSMTDALVILKEKLGAENIELLETES